jgi:hypothetical protein
VVNFPFRTLNRTKTVPNRGLFIEYSAPATVLSLASVPLAIELADLDEKVDFPSEE